MKVKRRGNRLRWPKPRTLTGEISIAPKHDNPDPEAMVRLASAGRQKRHTTQESGEGGGGEQGDSWQSGGGDEREGSSMQISVTAKAGHSGESGLWGEQCDPRQEFSHLKEAS